MQIIDRNGTGTAFVLNKDKKLFGIVTDGDIRRAILKGISIDNEVKTIATNKPVVFSVDIKKDVIARKIKEIELEKRVPNVERGTMKIPLVDNNGRIVDILALFKEKNKIIYESIFSKRKQKILKNHSIKKVLVIGGAGYLGSVLIRKLLKRGYCVRILDNLLFGDAGIKDLYGHENFEFIKGDVRSIEPIIEGIKGIDAVIHLAALVGDPASNINPQKTLEINYHSTKMIAEICKYHQINRFIFASTCSVYGKSSKPGEPLLEDSELNPVSLYARTKIESEKALLKAMDENFSPTIFRMATIYGLSPRMRFDLVINILTAKAYFGKNIPIYGGKQYRPVIHVEDATDAYIKCLEIPLDQVRGEIFNLGSNRQNYKIKDVGMIINKCIPEAKIDIQQGKTDQRSYYVSFDKTKKILNFDTKLNIDDGVKQIIKEMKKGRFRNYEDSIYSNYKSLL